ncbi:peptide chain release factor 1 [bacterium]|jgi:peptide chain release factor 1|nr:peptide chain release factor 1 [bacterium]
MITKLRELVATFEDVERRISDPEVIADQKKYQDLMRQHSELKDAVEQIREFETLTVEIEDTKSLLNDPDMKAIAEEELRDLETRQTTLHDDLQLFLIPKDPNDNKSAQMEIRQGTGGDEAALFAGELYRMYTKYAETQGWTIKILSSNISGLGGIKEIIFSIEGKNVFGKLKYEVGTHRVQRVPATESQGRVHTSAATVAVLAEAETVDIEINPADLRIDTFRASGAGGQKVNKTDSAVRITHLPTNCVVSCQDGRSQFQNKDTCMQMLRTQLYEMQMEEKRKANADLRKSQVGSGDRSEKIRTYNFPQGRVTDHRINLTLYTLEKVLEGDLSAVIDELMKAERLAKLSTQTTN